MISRNRLIAKLRELGYVCTKEKKRLHLYRKPGVTHRIPVPKRNHFDESTIRSILKQAGCVEKEIEEFLKEANSS